MKKRLLTILLAAAIGLSAGFVLRAILHPSKVPDPVDPVAENAPPEDGNPIMAGETHSGSSAGAERKAGDQEEADLSMSAGVARWLQWMAALESASLDDLPRLARVMAGNTFALSMLAARWIEEDPKHMFDTLAAYTTGSGGAGMPSEVLMKRLMDEWPMRDPHAVAAALTESDSPAALNWRRNVVSRIVESDPELGLRMFAEWCVEEDLGPRTGGIEKWARADPRHAAEFALAHRSGFVTELTLKAIGKVWGETDPAAALEFAAATPGKHGQQLADEAMRRWAEDDLAAAADWLAGADSATRQQSADAFVGVLAATDLTAALEWCQESLDPASIPGTLGALVRSVAAKDARHAADLVGSLEPSPFKTKAAMEVAHKWFPAHGTLAPAPPEAIEWMGSLDRATSGHVLKFIASQWAASDRDGFAEFLAGPGADNAPDSAYATLGAALARHDPPGALDWAQRLPAARSRAATQNVFRTWHDARPAEAIGWLESHSASQPPDAPSVRGAVEAVVTHHRADQILPKLPASLRPTARETVKQSQLAPQRQAELLEMLE